MKILCLSVTPSPYQRDLFRELFLLSSGQLTVCYFEGVPDDSPWDSVVLESWESILPGRVFGRGRVRCHWNWRIPDLRDYDCVIINAPLTAVTTCRVFEILHQRGGPPWFFWGELLIARSGMRGVVQRLLSKPLQRARAIVAIGSKAQADYQRRFPTQKVENIPYACALGAFIQAATFRKLSNSCRFLFAGQMIERKGVDVLLNAFAKLIGNGVVAELHLVGREGDLLCWLEQMSHQVQNRVYFHGFEQPCALPARFAAADVFVLPSRHDGWGVVINQALGSGMPVIASTAAGAGNDLIKDGMNGLHVTPGDVVSLEAAMFQLATRPERRLEMSVAASLSAKTIGPNMAAKRWFEVLKENHR